MIKRLYTNIVLLLFIFGFILVIKTDVSADCGVGSYHIHFCTNQIKICPPQQTGDSCYWESVPCANSSEQKQVYCSFVNGSCRYHVTDPGEICQGNSCVPLDGGSNMYWIDCTSSGGSGGDCDPKDRRCCSCPEEYCTPTCPAGTSPINYGEPPVTTASCRRKNGACNRNGGCMFIINKINCYPDNPPPSVVNASVVQSNLSMPNGCVFNANNTVGPYNIQNITTIFTDVQGRNDIVSLANWFARSGETPPNISYEDSTLDSTARVISNKRSYGLMVKKVGNSWNDLYFSVNNNTWKKVGTIGAGLRATMYDADGKVFARISDVTVVNTETPAGAVSLSYKIQYGNKNDTSANESNPPDGQYVLYATGNDINGSVLKLGRYARSYVFKATASNYLADYTQPIIDLFQASVHSTLANSLNLAWRVTDETSGIYRVMGDALRDDTGIINRISPTPSTLNYTFKTASSDLFNNNLFNITYNTKQNDVSRNEVIDLLNNFGGGINFVMGTYDNVCNYKTAFYNQTVSSNWIMSKAGYVYSRSGYKNIIPELTSISIFNGDSNWNYPTTFIQADSDITTEVYLSKFASLDDLVQNARLQNGVVVVDDIVNNKKDYWYDELKRRAISYASSNTRKYELHEYDTTLTLTGSIAPLNCNDTNKYCIIKSTKKITINQLLCNASSVIISDEDIEINPDITDSGVHGCIFLAKNNVIIKDGTFKSNNSQYPRYDEINGMLIADNQVLVEESQDTATTVADFSWQGDGKDGSITISSVKNINTDIIASGRTCADGINYNITSISNAGVTLSSSVTAGCIQDGDEVIIMNMQGVINDYNNVGKYEFKKVSSVSGVNIYFTDDLINTYGNGSGNTNIGTTTLNQRVILQRVPNYSNVTINSGGVLTSNSWNGQKGGILAFRVNGNLTLNGTGSINVSAKGYRGGERNIMGVFYGDVRWNGDSGESLCGAWPRYPLAPGVIPPDWANLALKDGYCGGGKGERTSGSIGIGSTIGGAGGGGAGSVGEWSSCSFYGGGGGAGYGTGGYGGWRAEGRLDPYIVRGENGTSVKSGNGSPAKFSSKNKCHSGGGGGGGGVYGDSKLTKIYLGSGGGGGGGWSCTPSGLDALNRTCTHGYTGNGGAGGGILYIAASTITSSPTSSIKSNGGNSGPIQQEIWKYFWGSGGAGSGGSIIILADNINATNVTAFGGTGLLLGGSGGKGRIALYYSSNESLVSDPVAYKELFTPLTNLSMKDGVKVSGSLIAFGSDSDTAILNKRTLGLKFSTQYPIIVVHYMSKYSELAKHVFGGSFDAFKKEVGFKPL